MLGRILCLYDPLMGHASYLSRGLLFKDEYKKNGWEVCFLDYRKVSAEEILREASQCDLTYTIKIADLTICKAIKEKTQSKLVFDLIDSLWTPVHQQAGWTNLDEIIKLSDAIFSDNEWVAAYGRKFIDKIFIIPACVQPHRFDEIKARTLIRSGNELVVGWVGSSGTVQALALVRDALDRLALKYPNLRFRILGCADPLKLPKFENLQVTALEQYDEETMISEMLGMDVGLFPAPLGMDDYVMRGGHKAFLYMAASVPPVCHNVGAWTSEIEEGVTGMFVNNSEDWYLKIDQLLCDVELRTRIGSAAHRLVTERYSIQRVFSSIDTAMRNVIRQDV
jgi:glycosyltransferase involved in cell wall biosynthesis